MSYKDEALWKILAEKTKKEDAALPCDQQVEHSYLHGVQTICDFAVERASRIQNNFPMFTLHDEKHICNVMRLMYDLLGDAADSLSRDEAAMLVLAACCHDIGMSYSKEADGDLLDNIDRLNRYLDSHRSEYVKAYAGGREDPIMTDDMILRFLRCIHHERVEELLSKLEWPEVLRGKVDRDDLVRVCRSHGENAKQLNDLSPTTTIDLRLCAILLRLADILDFDTSRAPHAVYEYCGFDQKIDPEALISREQWRIHQSSQGFDFQHVTNRSVPYELPYHATCKSMQIEQTVTTYLDWVDQELLQCGKQFSFLSPKWQRIVLPVKLNRTIGSEGYLSGQYRLTLDQEQVLDLLVGRDLYSDPAVFVRELIQNAIDAVRTREQLDNNPPKSWSPQIHIHTWTDEEGYYWFRIEDNGTGMTEEIIQNHLLKIGSSYYKSDLFEQEKLKCRANPNYKPISRFGIGILSCFMSDKKHNRVEISTKRFREDASYPPALRLSMQGLNGYYYMASSARNHLPGPMVGCTEQENPVFLREAGTVVAVRTNLHRSGKYRGFKEIVDKYVVYPPVHIHYEGEEGSFTYPTEAEFMEAVHQIQPSLDPAKAGLFEFRLSDDQLDALRRDVPGIDLSTPPKVLLKCAALDRYTSSPNLSGAIVAVSIMDKIPPVSLRFGAMDLDMGVGIALEMGEKTHKLSMKITLSPPQHKASQMQALVELYERSFNPDFAYELQAHFKGDECKNAIIAALSGDFIKDRRWKNYMRDRFSLTASALQNHIQEVTAAWEQLSRLSAEEQETVRSYKAQTRRWSFPVCDLSEYSWFQEYFLPVRRNTTFSALAVHNGIACGPADFFCGASPDYMIGAVLLLKDSYCPELDLARDRVRAFPLETICDLGSVRRRINAEGFYFEPYGKAPASAGYSDLPLQAYWALLDRRPDLAASFSFSTNHGALSVAQLSRGKNTHADLKLSDDKPILPRFDWSWNHRGADWCLKMAYLQKHYSLKADFSASSFSWIYPEIQICERNSDASAELLCDFPPFYFLPPVEAASMALTKRDPDHRSVFNSEHRLSKFILQNAALLRLTAPGLLQELLQCLAGEAVADLISKVNTILTQIRKLPNTEIQVPDTLSLTEEDFC